MDIRKLIKTKIENKQKENTKLKEIRSQIRKQENIKTARFIERQRGLNQRKKATCGFWFWFWNSFKKDMATQKRREKVSRNLRLALFGKV